MRRGLTFCALGLGVLATFAAPLPAAANGFPPAAVYTTTVTTAPSLGTVVSAASGDTVFTIDPSTGIVTRTSGSGVRVSTSTTRAAVSIRCGNESACNTTYVVVKVGPLGSPTKRARALTNFTVAMNTAVEAAPTEGANPLLLGLDPIPQNATRTFYIGFDYGIAGDSSGLASGAASSGFYVYVTGYPNTNPTTGTTSSAAATVYRPITLSNPTGLVFGSVVRPASGSGTVVINDSTGARTLTGGVVALSTPTPSKAAYTVTGEGGQSFSLSIPTSFAMTTTGGSVTVTLTSTATGSQTLSSSIGSAGTFGFSIGGSLPVASTTKDGAYTGTFTVSVQYN